MKHKWKCVYLVALLLLLQIMPVFAAPIKDGGSLDAITQSEGVKPGEEITIVLKLTNVPDYVDALGVEFKFNDTEFAFVSDKWLTEGGQASTDKQNHKSAWGVSTARAINGDFYQLTLKIKNDIKTKNPEVVFDVIGKCGDEVAYSGEVKASVRVSKGVMVSGSIISFGSAEDEVTLELKTKDGQATNIDSVRTTERSYQFVDVEEGEYILQVSKKNHAPREYEITVSGETSNQDVEIYLYGDFDKDGTVKAADITAIARCLGKLEVKTDPYQLQLGDVDGVEGLSAKDITCIARYLGKLISNFPVCQPTE